MLVLAPPALATLPPAAARDWTGEIRSLLGIPYIEDGVPDESGHWSTFTHPERRLDHPGLNCSGFVVAAARRILKTRLTLAQMTRDRLGDSGEGARLGKDWDFGWDLILNLSDNRPRRWFLPEGTEAVETRDGRNPRGFHIQEGEGWAKLFPLMKGNALYLATLSRNLGSGIRHHHVAFLLKDLEGRVWFYQTLPRGRSHRLEISAPSGFERLRGMFGPGEWILLLEVDCP
jgi:hypothetical protein